jgi:hypothetical protein
LGFFEPVGAGVAAGAAIFDESAIIFDESIAGAAAGAAVVSAAGAASSAFLHATRATTERARAKRFIE